MRMAIFGASLVLAWLTWRFVELPVRRWLPQAALRRRAAGFVGATIFALVGLGGAGWFTHAYHGIGTRYPRLDQLSGELSRQGYFANRGAYHKCSGTLATGNDLTWCETSESGQPDVALLGDSHADHLFPGIAAASRENWLLIAQAACPPLYQVRVSRWGSQESCTTRNLLAVQLVNSASHIKTVVLTLHGPAYVRDAPRALAVSDAPSLDASPSQPSMATKDLFEYGLSAELAGLQTEGRNVVLFIDVPELSFEPTD